MPKHDDNDDRELDALLRGPRKPPIRKTTPTRLKRRDGDADQ